MVLGSIRTATCASALGSLVVPALQAQDATPAAPVEAPLASVESVVDPFLERDVVGGVEVLFLRGTDEERARALGAHRMPKVIELFESFALAKELGLSPLAWGFAVLPKSRKVLAELTGQRERYEHMLEGAVAVHGPSSLVVPQLNRPLTVDDLMAVTLLPDFMGLGCSSFAAWGEEVQGSGPVVGRNLDYFGSEVMLEQSGLVVHAPLGDRAGWVSIGWAGLDGCLTGVSDRGVSVAIHDVDDSRVDDRRVKVTPRITALQELITRLRPGPNVLEQAERILEEHRFGYGANVMVAWRGGEGFEPGGAVFEVHAAGDAESVADEVVARAPDRGDQWIVCTNHHRNVDEIATCRRYHSVVTVLEPEAAPIDEEGASDLIGRPEVRSTLYQTVADLERLHLTVRLRRPGGRWDEAAFSVAELIQRATDRLE